MGSSNRPEARRPAGAPHQPEVTVRPALPEDAPRIAQIHWDSWQASYRGILPEACLGAFSLPAREALWRSTALVAQRAPDKRQLLLVAADAGDAAAAADAPLPPPLLGFACVGPLHSNGDVAAAPGRGELWALYLRPDARRRGVGRALWQAAASWLHDDAGFTEMALWVLAANTTAIAFYRAQGCQRIGAGSFDAAGVSVAEECWRIALA